MALQVVRSGTEKDVQKAMIFPTKEGEWSLPEELEAELHKTYLNVDAELAKARLWLIANENRRKTRRGMGRFITGWLARGGQLRPVAVPYSIRAVELVHEQPTDKAIARAAMQQIKAMVGR